MINLLKIEFLQLQKDFMCFERNLYSSQEKMRLLQNTLASEKNNEEVIFELRQEIEHLKRKISCETRYLGNLKANLFKVKVTLDSYVNKRCEQNLLDYNRCLISYKRMVANYLDK